jgi:glucoamylase
MLPEQVWDAEPIPARGLEPGRPTGGAMPLVWAHAEYIKLLVSRGLKRPFDRPEAVWQRYRGERPVLKRVIWAEHAPADELPQGCALTLALREAGTFRFGRDGWQDVREQETTPHPLGLHLLDVDTAQLAAGQRIDVTFRRAATSAWAGRDYCISVIPGTAPSA